MIENLELNFTKFEALIQMLKNDEMSVVHPNWIQPEGKISDERWAQYNEIFDDLKLSGGLRSWGGESIWFIGFSSGYMFGGSAKGYMYKPENPSLLYQSLDVPPADLPSNKRGYRFIRENWYLEYKWDD